LKHNSLITDDNSKKDHITGYYFYKLLCGVIIMGTYAIWYRPVWGQMTRYVEYVKANNGRQAEIKFYATRAGDNCQSIILIERC
jgi:hypothetical protein